ncbi:MAG: hydrogenase, partial [Candidatus Heimdallarchaeaceae archaeon]
MKTYKMDKENFPEFVKLIQTKGKLFGPVKQKGKHSFEEINSFDELDFDYERTQIELKKFLTPPRYTTQKFTKEEVEEVLPENGKTIVIGPHPCDIHGVKILDSLFLGNIKDPYYAKRRKDLIIIGHSC